MTVVDAFQAATEKLAAETERLVLDVYAAWKAGRYSQPEAELAIAGIINRANASAVTLADVYLAAQIEDALGAATPAVGVAPVDDAQRLAKAVHTVLSEPPKTSFTRGEIRELIASADLDVDLWDVPAITAAVNASLRDMLPDDDDPDFVPDDTVYDFEDFVETVAEHPRPLKDLGLWPPPPPDTGGVDPARDARYAQWEADYDAARPDIDSDDYAGRQPIWEAEPDGAEDRLARLARAEPLDTAQQATVAAIRSHDVVAGWVRQTDADPCQLCQFWYRDGYVWPKDKQFQRHTGCNCQPKIVLAEHTRERIAS